jgi:hypothetical protein
MEGGAELEAEAETEAQRPVRWLPTRVVAVGSPPDEEQQQLLVALYLYRRCHVCHSRTVDVPTRDLAENWGISRTTKYRVLGHLEQAGVVAVSSRTGRTIKVTLSHWPDPPLMSVRSAS